MTGSCPVSARVCRETARERDELRAEVERLRAGALNGPTLHRLEDVAEEFGVDLTEGETEMSDHLDRAAEVIAAQMHGLTTPSMCRGLARALEEAGMLAFPERDAAVAAKALRDAADDMNDTDDPDAIHVDNGDIDKWLRARADRIEEEAGVSNADA